MVDGGGGRGGITRPSPRAIHNFSSIHQFPLPHCPPPPRPFFNEVAFRRCMRCTRRFSPRWCSLPLHFTWFLASVRTRRRGPRTGGRCVRCFARWRRGLRRSPPPLSGHPLGDFSGPRCGRVTLHVRPAGSAEPRLPGAHRGHAHLPGPPRGHGRALGRDRRLGRRPHARRARRGGRRGGAAALPLGMAAGAQQQQQQHRTQAIFFFANASPFSGHSWAGAQSPLPPVATTLLCMSFLRGPCPS